MSAMDCAIIEKIYAGWLGKMIGIRLGAPIESWTYDKIKNVYGEVQDYLVDYKDFAADDDSNGPAFFVRALEDCRDLKHFSAQDVAEALLNYAPFEHGFFWWGGYGISTEHTAYLNLRAGIPAPRSGSIQQNGSTMAEQIGGQIFIDCWGLVAPGNPKLAAELAEKAASVTHGGNGIWGGVYIAVCISLAFVEQDIPTILKKALDYVPADCDYAKAVEAVAAYHREHPHSWRDCYEYIRENWGYNRYPGNCHIIPNTAVMILALLYGGGDFSETLNICNMCGWDTDCNVGNVGTIMGILCGLEGIGTSWREPVNDLLICSGALGSLNILDVPYVALHAAKMAALLSGETLPGIWGELAGRPFDSCHFEFPGSTHAMRVRPRDGEERGLECRIANTDESARTGSRSLKLTATALQPGREICLYKKTYYRPADLHDSRYDPEFSPLAYPGQTLRGSVCVPDCGCLCAAQLYARESRSGELLLGERVTLHPGGGWQDISLEMPSCSHALIDETGFLFTALGEDWKPNDLAVLVDHLACEGNPCYTIDFAGEESEWWTVNHIDVSQFSRLKGYLYLENDSLHLSGPDFGEAYTGRHDWRDYAAEFALKPVTGEHHRVNFRIQGAIRSYAAGFDGSGKLALLKNENGYRELSSVPFDWKPDQEYRIRVETRGNDIRILCDSHEMIHFQDVDRPYLTGCIGLSVAEGSHLACRTIAVDRV